MSYISESHSDSYSESIENISTESSEIVHLINAKSKKCKKSRVSEILIPEIFTMTGQEFIILIQNPSEQTIIKIRTAYELHPVIEYECNSTSYIKDHMIKLDHCLFLTLTDIPQSGDLSSPSSLKIILKGSIMFVLVKEKLQCIEEIFVKAMKFNIFHETLAASKEEPIIQPDFIIKKRFTIKLDLVELYELTALEELLYKLLHVMFIRIEERVSNMDSEVKICNDFVTQLEYTDRIDLIMRVHQAKKELIAARGYIDFKSKLLPEIIESKILSKTFNQYLYSMSLNMKKLKEKIDSSMLLLKSSENLYEAIVEGRLSKSSERVNEMLKIYSAATAMFLPLYLVAGFFGMNVKIPFRSDEYVTLLPFGMICLGSFCYLVAVIMFFRYRKWL